MTFNQAPSYRNRNKDGKKRFKKSMVIVATGVTFFVAGASETFEPLLAPLQPQLVRAAEIKNGTQIGTLNNVPVVQSTTADMSSDAFQSLVDSLLEDQNLDKVKYVADKIQWNSNTEVKGVGGVQVGDIVSIFGTNIASFLMADGYEKSDTGAYLNPGQSLAVTNVGTITNIDTAEKIPVDLIITHVDVVHGADGWSNKDVAMAIKNQSSVITIGVAVPTGGGIGSSSGGQTEDGGAIGGSGGTGRAVGWIEQTSYTATLVRSDTKTPIPNEEILMAMKVSDIDGSQHAVVDKQGVIGYIVGPDTNLTLRDGGLATTTSVAINQDSTQLSPASYVVLKNFNSNFVSYAYTDGAGNHLDIVTGLFGNTGFKVNADTTGSIEILKTGTESGTDMWNANYNLKGNKFKLTDKKTGKTYEGTTDEKGRVVIDKLPFGTYTVEEESASNGFAKTFKTTEVTISKDTPKKTINGKEDQLITVNGTNDEIKGQNTLEKQDKDTGTTPQGQAVLKNAEYALFYNDTSTGSSPHKQGDPVKWADVPNATVLKGEKVASSIVNGATVEHGDNVVLNVDDTELAVAVGNLAVGKYYWQEINAPEGYAIDATKHEFEIKKADDATKNIITPNVKSLEQVIKAKISIQKIAQASGDGSSSGINDVTFKATPINDTKADAFEFSTGIKDDEDGYATTELTYGDWKIEEVEAPEGYALIDPVYIHMSYDEKTDLYTITASHNEDGSSPFSKRTFSQSDDESGKNGNATGSVAGVLTSSNAVISLSKMTLKDNATPPSTPPTFQPEKFDLSESKFDITGDKLMDDDNELKDEYGDTNKDPYADKTDNNEPQNLNTKTVKRGDTIYYQVWLDATKLTDADNIAITGITDDYDEKRLILLADKIVGYDSVTGEVATQLFDITNKDGKLSIQTKADLVKDGKLDATKFLFGRYYKFEIPATVKDDVVAGEDIFNTASQFVTFKDGKTTEKPTQKRVNKVEDPTPQPHKFVLDKAGYDVKGTSLLDDDSELKDRYADTNKDPYVDKKDNNDKDNINTDTVKAGKVLHYQVWIDTTIWNKDSLLQTVGGTDNYDERYVSVDIANIKIYNKKTGKDVTDQFTITDKDGKLSFLPKDSVKKDYKTADGKTVKILDTGKFELGVIYQVEIPATVKKDVPAGVDIENTASQTYTDVDGKTHEIPTEKRVNKTPKGNEAPKQPSGSLPSTGEIAGYGLTFLGFGTLIGLVEWKTRFVRKSLQKALKRTIK